MASPDTSGDTPHKDVHPKRHKGENDNKSAGGRGGSTSFSSSAGAAAAAPPSAPSSLSSSVPPSGGNPPRPGTTSAYEERALMDKGLVLSTKLAGLFFRDIKTLMQKNFVGPVLKMVSDVCHKYDLFHNNSGLLRLPGLQFKKGSRENIDANRALETRRDRSYPAFFTYNHVGWYFFTVGRSCLPLCLDAIVQIAASKGFDWDAALQQQLDQAP